MRPWLIIPALLAGVSGCAPIGHNDDPTPSYARSLPDGRQELTGWIVFAGTELLLYPDEADLGETFKGSCISGTALFDIPQADRERLSAKRVRVIASTGPYRELTTEAPPSVENYCASEMVFFADSVALAD